MSEHDIIKTKIFKSNKDFISQRVQRITEAIAFKSGTIENPKKHIISTLPNGKESYFYKPGKETLRKKPNVHDMWPNVGANGISETENWTFEKIWEYLIKISVISQSTFKKVLVLLYRNCFLLDYQEIEVGKLRYLPSKEILDYINNIETFVLKDGFMDKFRSKEIGLLEYLYFIDLLGWNEDVKYHIVDNKPDFLKGGKRVGRVNTILSVISVPLMINDFILKLYIDKIKIKLLLSTLLKPSKPKNIWDISNKQLIKHLSPHLIG